MSAKRMIIDLSKLIFKTKGTCSRTIEITLEDDIVKEVHFIGGCDGNAAGISLLVKGMKASEVIEKLEGVRCGYKLTSCPDQLAKGLKEMLAVKA